MLLTLDKVYINLIHITVIGPLLYYLGIQGSSANKYARLSIGAIALLITVLMKKPEKKFDYWNIVRMAHYGVMLPVLLYVALKSELPSQVNQVLVVTGLVVISYHFYKAYERRADLPFVKDSESVDVSDE